MATLKENLPNRIRKLAKPGNAAQALQPLFEAVSNAVMAIDDRIEAGLNTAVGQVTIEVEDIGSDDIEIRISDNGIGLDADRFDAFCTVDTGYKSEKGGKGVGRLYWLDAFREIHVQSRFTTSEGIETRTFRFNLSEVDQVVDCEASEAWPAFNTGTLVKFSGLRQGPYLEKFPKKADDLQSYLAAHFISDFLAGAGHAIRLKVTSGEAVYTDVTYPKAVRNLVVRGPVKLSDLSIAEVGTFSVDGYLCDPMASRGLAGKHQVHLLGNNRTVESRKVDDLLGIHNISHDEREGLAMHLIVRGEFFDERVAESRTAFVIPDSVLQTVVKEAINVARRDLIPDQVELFNVARRKAFDNFLANQPIFAIGTPEEVFKTLPLSATNDEAFVRHLAVPRMRAEKNREKALQDLVGAVVSGDKVPEDFPEIVRRAAEGIHQNARSSLAHHAARRRVVLDLLDALIRRVRSDPERDDKYHLEKTLHSLLAPMQVVSTDPKFEEQSAHDLWIVDERLAFASGFASDRSLRSYVSGSTDKDRPDLVIWDTGFGLGTVAHQGGLAEIDDAEPLSKVFVVELKHPGRKSYGPDESIERQVKKYVSALKNGEIEGFGRRNIKVTPDCQFHCFVVADFLGGFADEVEGWDFIYNKRGRRRQLGGAFSSVVIEAVEWDYVLSTARTTNRALLDAAGLGGHGKTDFAKAPASDVSETSDAGDQLMAEQQSGDADA